MKILGIDPGYAIMGYSVVEKKGNNISLLDVGAITTDKDLEMSLRLKILYEALMEVIAKHNPDEASIEELYFNTNAKTVIFVGEARGVAILACANSGIPIYEYTPLQIKTSLTGNGRAEKKQVQSMVKKILCMADIIRPDDAADAVAAAITHAQIGESKKRITR